MYVLAVSNPYRICFRQITSLSIAPFGLGLHCGAEKRHWFLVGRDARRFRAAMAGRTPGQAKGRTGFGSQTGPQIGGAAD
ncbi:hypothetical protein GCM10027562_08960 [Arthrobacter pigmenti]